MNGYLANRGLFRAVLVAVVLFVGLFVLWRLFAGIVTMVLVLLAGLLLAVARSGPVEALQRRKVPRSLGVALVVGGILAVLGLGGYLLSPLLTQQAVQLSSAMPNALSRIDERIQQLTGGLGLNLGGLGDISTPTLGGWARDLLGGVIGVFGSLASVLLGLVVILFLAMYLAAIPGPAVGWFVRFFPPDRRPRVRDLLSQVRSGLLRWLRGQLVSMATIGGLAAGALYFIGIPGALFLGLLTGLLEFVPYIGPIVSVIPPLLLALAGDPLDALWVLLAYLAIQQAETNLITPLVMRQAASLHPAAVIASVTILGEAFGILGALLAVPAIVVAGILARELWFKRLERDSWSSRAKGGFD